MTVEIFIERKISSYACRSNDFDANVVVFATFKVFFTKVTH